MTKNWKRFLEEKQDIIVPCVSFGLAILLVGTGVIVRWQVEEEEKRLDAEAVSVKENLEIEFGEKVKVSDLLENLEGELVEDFIIEPAELGEQKVDFQYINERGKQRAHELAIKVVDTTAPKIYGLNNYTVNVGYQGDLTDLMMSGDNYDDHPVREVIGDCNLNTAGKCELEYQITDASGNQARQKFTLNIVEPSGKVDMPVYSDPIDITEIVAKHKTAKTKIGIDVSQWQGEINWERVKADGVEFAFIRVGYQAGYDGEYVLDPYFEKNITEANRLRLPVGVYFYSYATNIEEAKKQAEWVVERLNGHKAELGVAFDWEDWGNFNDAGMSFSKINLVANAFLDTVAEAGYKGLIYGSKVYLDRVWQPEKYPVWLAQYYHMVTYDGDYQYWQMSDSGRVDGIYGDVDVDIMYLK